LAFPVRCHKSHEPIKEYDSKGSRQRYTQDRITRWKKDGTEGVVRQMDNGLKHYTTYMWREFRDEWYRIQTNCPTVIQKLKRRENVKEVGRTVRGSSQYWRIFRLKYNKPSTARRSLIRLTNCRNKLTVKNGLYRAETVAILNSSEGS
jgi:hypothetical protein